jgi:hypothetical protein
MTLTKWIDPGDRGFWAYDVAAGVFLKYLIDAAEAKGQADTPFLAKALSQWRVQAVITECGFTLEESWTALQRQNFIAFAEEACARLASRESIPAEEIVSWQLKGDLRIFLPGAKEVNTAPVIELGRAIIALVSGGLLDAPRGEAWFHGTPTGRSTIKMSEEWGEMQRMKNRLPAARTSAAKVALPSDRLVVKCVPSARSCQKES